VTETSEETVDMKDEATAEADVKAKADTEVKAEDTKLWITFIKRMERRKKRLQPTTIWRKW
jgi:hypothetical protein